MSIFYRAFFWCHVLLEPIFPCPPHSTAHCFKIIKICAVAKQYYRFYCILANIWCVSILMEDIVCQVFLVNWKMLKNWKNFRFFIVFGLLCAFFGLKLRQCASSCGEGRNRKEVLRGCSWFFRSMHNMGRRYGCQEIHQSIFWDCCQKIPFVVGRSNYSCRFTHIFFICCTILKIICHWNLLQITWWPQDGIQITKWLL